MEYKIGDVHIHNSLEMFAIIYCKLFNLLATVHNGYNNTNLKVSMLRQSFFFCIVIQELDIYCNKEAGLNKKILKNECIASLEDPVMTF